MCVLILRKVRPAQILYITVDILRKWIEVASIRIENNSPKLQVPSSRLSHDCTRLPCSRPENMQKVSKLNSSIDIIPLQGSSGDYRSRYMDNKYRMFPDQRCFRDQSLIARVQTVTYHNRGYFFRLFFFSCDTIKIIGLFVLYFSYAHNRECVNRCTLFGFVTQRMFKKI